MKTKLSIQEKLKDLRIEHHLTLEQLAEETGISKSTLGSYENEEYKDISHTNLIVLAKYYGISTDYLLGLTENRTLENIAVSELHLNDSMIALLKQKSINTRLLCELVSHKDFPKLLSDIEIYVDGIATTQINNVNSIINAIRLEILDKYHPESDHYLHTLEAATVDEERYFTNIIEEDINNIVHDLRNAHKKDSESMEHTLIANELKKDLEEVAAFQGSPEEKQALLFCKNLGINYHRLTEEEFYMLGRILRKSRYYKATTNQKKQKRRKK